MLDVQSHFISNDCLVFFVIFRKIIICLHDFWLVNSDLGICITAPYFRFQNDQSIIICRLNDSRCIFISFVSWVENETWNYGGGIMVGSTKSVTANYNRSHVAMWESYRSLWNVKTRNYFVNVMFNEIGSEPLSTCEVGNTDLLEHLTMPTIFDVVNIKGSM